MGYTNFSELNETIDEGEGFIQGNKLTVQVDFKLLNIVGLKKFRRMDFTDPSGPTNDVSLVIEGEKVYVNKGHLSVHSPVFCSMFYGDFVERSQNEIELKDVDRKEFIEMLHVIYPPSKKITEANLGYLLKLGDRFEVEVVVDQIEKFLIKSTKFSLAAKLVIADQYRLFGLQGHCLDRLTSVRKVTDLSNSEESNNFSSHLKSVLFDKIVELNKFE
ncbi:hypothetical protein PMAYCL1PPCAC_24770 [Pristionchus mayeri]|uniref:BTB domain-containing protein n=1 Tax=Pristionchus mayeri TaxID=1317129 RepID=A0AAN5D1X0_9BILA|nr:hypothetical protein PMAYCL1PPCAC_24770 [Pristionchus mayeri]